jgi:hypothetical protein
MRFILRNKNKKIYRKIILNNNKMIKIIIIKFSKWIQKVKVINRQIQNNNIVRSKKIKIIRKVVGFKVKRKKEKKKIKLKIKNKNKIEKIEIYLI